LFFNNRELPMAYFAPEAEEYQRKRWMRPDAERWFRPDAARWMTPEEARVLLPDSMQPERKDDPAPARVRRSREQQAREERARKTEILRLKWQIAALRFQRAQVLRILTLQRKAYLDRDTTPINPACRLATRMAANGLV
jgi:hypothetical protein